MWIRYVRGVLSFVTNVTLWLACPAIHSDGRRLPEAQPAEPAWVLPKTTGGTIASARKSIKESIIFGCISKYERDGTGLCKLTHAQEALETGAVFHHIILPRSPKRVPSQYQLYAIRTESLLYI